MFLNPLKCNFSKFHTSRTIIKDKEGQDWVQLIWWKSNKSGSVILYDFSSKFRISILQNMFSLYAPETLLKNASGILIDGYNDILITKKDRKKRRDVNGNQNCVTICSRLLRRELSFINSKIFLQQCIDECSKSK